MNKGTGENGIPQRVAARVLACVQGMDLDPVLAAELGLETLKRAEKSAGKDEESVLKTAMRELDALLAERGVAREPDVSRGRLDSAPPMNRRNMLAEEMDITPLRSAIKRLFRRQRAAHPWSSGPGAGGRFPWRVSATLRRLVLLALIVIPTAISASIMHSLLPTGGYHALRVIITALFAVLFAWISVGFWSSVAGLAMLFTRSDRFALARDMNAEAELPTDARTALLFPVYNEDAAGVTGIVRTVYQAIKKKGFDRHFDIFILSDTTNPDVWVNEEEAWYNLCREENAFGRVFYRRRKKNMKRKSGNIADFCRRWGANYRYMIVFDADSLISADALAQMVKLMEANPSIGILQTPPKIMKAHSFFARAQQFANHLYGPLFAAGLHYWQLGDAQYWGHNAIIRVEPFMRHCQLRSLPGRAPFGGDILSHDFVESALMRRAGYGVWLVYDLDGSYEQTPPGLIEELVRDRRWCQGNLQHFRLIFTRGFFPTHRALFINGIMSYVSALLWFLFLLASSAQAIAELFVIPNYFPESVSLFPKWPQYLPNWALSLFSATMTLLFLPKLFSLALIIGKGGAGAFGGAGRMMLSMLAEVVLSTLLAPIRMLFHSIFVISALFGVNSGWNAQRRDDSGTAWGEAVRFYWKATLLGAAWGGLMYVLNPGFFIWISPIAAGLVLSIPFTVWSSRVSLGRKARRLGLFLTPVETSPPAVILKLEKNLQRPVPYSPIVCQDGTGFVRAAVLPRLCNLHSALATHKRRNSAEKLRHLAEITEKALADGPGSLSPKEKLDVLNDPPSLMALHKKIWTLPPRLAELWGIR